MCAVLVATVLAGCATSKTDFYADSSKPSVAALCRAHKTALEKDAEYARDLARELSRRGTEVSQCESEIAKQNDKIGKNVAKGIVAGLLIAAAVAVARKGGGGGGGGYGGVAWDEFYNDRGRLIWRCREMDTGRFTDDYRCAGQPRIDSQWPSKVAPSRYFAY